MRPLPFSDLAFAVPFWAIVVLWLGLEAGRVRSVRAVGAEVRDRGSLAVALGGVMLGTLLCFAVSVLLPGATIVPLRGLIAAVGMLLMLCGVWLRWYAIRVLGRYFTVVVAIRPGQQVITTGPYRTIRHPAYSGALLTLVALGLALTNWASIVAVLLPALAGLGYRVVVEERELRASLGAPYAEYMRHTRRLIPYLF